MTHLNRQIKLISYAAGLPSAANFELAETSLPTPQPGEIVVQTHYLSMDPFPRLRMSGKAGSVPQLPLGSVMIGRGVGQVITSHHPEFAEGSFVAGELGWQTYHLSDGAGLRLVDPQLGPISTSLGVLGPSGLAAYFSTLRHGQPQPDETVIINAASGSVASIAGQIAKLKGARVVGIVGSASQADYILEQLGLDAAIDYTTTSDLAQAIGEACPNGVDVFLDLVGGAQHDAVMAHINVGVRIVLVGTLSNYNLGPGEVDSGPRHLFTWNFKRARISGFMVGDYAAEFGTGLHQLAEWVRNLQIVYHETIFEGLEACPSAFAGLFSSDHVGKMLVKVVDGG